MIKALFEPGLDFFLFYFACFCPFIVVLALTGSRRNDFSIKIIADSTCAHLLFAYHNFLGILGHLEAGERLEQLESFLKHLKEGVVEGLKMNIPIASSKELS